MLSAFVTLDDLKLEMSICVIQYSCSMFLLLWLTNIQLLIDAMCLQENDVPLPMLLDFHGWTENTMGHENDGHNFFQVDFRCKRAEIL